MLTWVAESIGFEGTPPPCPKHSRLEDWFLGSESDTQFLSYQKCMRSWWNRGRHLLPEHSTLAPSGGKSNCGTSLPAKCRHLAGLPETPIQGMQFYLIPHGESLHSLWTSCVCPKHHGYPAVLLGQGVERSAQGGPNPEMMQQLRSMTDYELQAMKVTVQALGRVMSTLVVQERHLWFNLTGMLRKFGISVPPVSRLVSFVTLSKIMPS